MTKTELVDRIAEVTDITKKGCGPGGRRRIREHSGKPGLRGSRPAHRIRQLRGEGEAGEKGRNPQTGVEIVIPARRTAVFKPGKALKDRVDPEAAAKDAE